MKKIRIGLLIALFPVLAAAAAYAQTPDLSGEWKLNLGRSDLGELAAMNPEISLSIRQEGGVLIMRKSLSAAERKVVRDFRYTLDGKESLNDGESLKGLRGTAVFEKGVLLIRAEQEAMKMTVQGDNPAEIEYFKYDSVEEFTLAADGKTLTVVQTKQLPEGPSRTTSVFEKAAA
jgi:hypothetical protein